MDEDESSQFHRKRPRVAVLYCSSDAYSGEREKEKLADGEIIEVANAVQSALELNGLNSKIVCLDPNHLNDLKNYDLIFNLAETIYGFPMTDYQVAQVLEAFNIPFTGAGSECLKMCLDKAITKKVLRENGLPTPNFEIVEPDQQSSFMLNYPLIVKPVHEDGCVGISDKSVVQNNEQLSKLIRDTHTTYQQSALVEEYIDGRDITASVLGDHDDAMVLPLSEIIYTNNGTSPTHLTFESNWAPETLAYQTSHSQCPAVIEKALEKRIRAIALKASQVMGCRGYTRVDFRIRGNEIFILEVNPNPCINPDGAGFVKAANASGLAYAEMINRIIGFVQKGNLTNVSISEKVLA